ncbi:MAG: mechanosensitive ion channel family protein, partial [Bdellovibrionota bacterium]
LCFGLAFISEIFGIRLMPLLATSAIFSAVIGLAVQDTLINLFAGIALQFDNSFEIGDWIEVNTSGQKFSGRVIEVSWRSVLMEGYSDERITVSNRTIAQGQITNYSSGGAPLLRSQVFRIPYGADLTQVETALIGAVGLVQSALKTPSPVVLFNDAAESWISAKLIYGVENFGSSFKTGDLVIRSALGQLQELGVTLSPSRIKVEMEKK